MKIRCFMLILPQTFSMILEAKHEISILCKINNLGNGWSSLVLKFSACFKKYPVIENLFCRNKDRASNIFN